MTGWGLLDPEYDTRVRALGAAAQDAGYDPKIVSGFRSQQDQARAIDSVARSVYGRPASFMDYSRGIPGYAAPVGGSEHQKGLATDWADNGALPWLRQNAPRFGVRFPESLAKTDPVHSELDSKFYGPVQDPNDRAAAVASASGDAEAQPGGFYGQPQPQTAPQTRMALGGPPAPTGGQRMPESSSGTGWGLLDGLVSGMQSPLFQSGAAMVAAGSQGLNPGAGFLAGSEAAGKASQQALLLAKQKRELEQMQLRDQLWRDITAGNNPTWAKGLPEGTIDMARALGPDAGANLITTMMTKNADRDLDLRRLAMQEQADRRSAALQEAQLAQAKSQTPQWRMENYAQFGIKPNTQEWRQFVVNGTIPGKSDIATTAEERAAVAQSLGMKPDSPQYQSYVATGKMPREDQQPMTATDKKAVLEADEMVLAGNEAIRALKLGLDLSKKAFSGTLASQRAAVSNMMPWNTPESQATTEMEQVITSQALAQLKSIFGAAPTEGERKILLDIQGSANQPQAVREAILQRALAAAERRLQFHKERADQLRGGTYYGGKGGSGAWKGGDTPPAPAAPADNDPLGLR